MNPWATTVAERSAVRKPTRWLLALTLAFGLAAGTFAGPAQAAVNLVVNGGFETGNLSGWLQLNNLSFSGVLCPGPGQAPEGSCAGYFGPVAADGTLSQSIATTPGAVYSVSFAFAADGGSPAHFSATWDGQVLMNITNPAASNFHVFSFLATASGATATLAFNFRDDSDFLYLDAVSVSAVAEPAASALFALGIAGLWAGARVAARRRRPRQPN